MVRRKMFALRNFVAHALGEMQWPPAPEKRVPQSFIAQLSGVCHRTHAQKRAQATLRSEYVCPAQVCGVSGGVKVDHAGGSTD